MQKPLTSAKSAPRRAGAFCVAAAIAAALLAGCADGRFDHPGPPHPGAANPWSNGGFSDPGPNYPATGH
ncbi:hypothetical protein [Bordetella sp. N]|uniref:hypothetical protein n=1 Tax=Bordetella sp. N TaxID=1746199 RepID=UPI00070D8CB4|nr:hypothetical protein [Bordetella sp. N]ALM82718.1 hypothetical protein ASB57_06890 [Bordetella sp. N]